MKPTTIFGLIFTIIGLFWILSPHDTHQRIFDFLNISYALPHTAQVVIGVVLVVLGVLLLL